MRINIYIWGLPYDEEEEGPDYETEAAAECEHEFGSSSNCLVIDVLGKVLLNTVPNLEIGRTQSS